MLFQFIQFNFSPLQLYPKATASLMGKASVYILTFWVFTSLHMMRTTYSFNKSNFQKCFGLSNLLLGTLDSVLFLSLAIGMFSRYSILNSKKPVEACIGAAIPCTIGFLVIPLVTLFGFYQQGSISQVMKIIIILSVIVFGFFQLSFFPATLTIFSSQFSVKKNPTAVGIWSSKANVGNIVGFFMANVLVQNLGVAWQYTMIISAIMIIISSLLLYKLVDNPDFKDEGQVTTGQFCTYFCSIWALSEFKLYILSYAFFKDILFSVEFWMPKFLDDAGFKQFSGYIPMLFDIFIMIGAGIMSKIYKKEGKAQDKNPGEISFLSKYKFVIPAIIVVFCCVGFIILPGSLMVYFGLAAVMGLFLGSVYNSLESNEVLNYTKGEPKKTDMLGTINIGFGSFTIGISQYIIGFVLSLGAGHKEEGAEDVNLQESVAKEDIFKVIGVIALIGALLIFFKAIYTKPPTDIKDDQIEMELIDVNTKAIQTDYED